MTELLKKLVLTSGVSGREDKIREVIKAEAEKYADEIIIDPMGNLIAHKRGKGKKIMFASHMDEIGYFVTFIDEKGLIRVGNVGGINTLSASYSEVVSERGVCGVALPSDSNEVPKVDALCIDIGARSKKQAEKRVSIGDYFVHAPHIKRLYGNIYTGRPLDNRIGCLVLLEALKNVKPTDNDLYFVFTVQEEVGLRGAKPVAYRIEPDIGIAIDVTSAGGKPTSPKTKVKIGGGVAIKIKDASVICSYEIVEKMRELCLDSNIKYQDEILLKGGTDTGAIQTAKMGCLVGALSIPTAYIHSTNEMIDISDVKEAIKLTCAIAERI
ncbi:MAG: M20/M25/M40 family metallo-hydrolase [Clostridia bacterium]|nr:M20/M25/M40 family metallo-hydrolase [Clostridia bacterium]